MKGRNLKRRARVDRKSAHLLVCLLAVALVLLAAVGSASALGASPKLEVLSVHGPTNVPLTPTVDQTKTIEVFTEEEGRPNAGRFKLLIERGSKKGKTAPLRFDASREAVQHALEEVKTIGAGNVSVSGGPTPGAESWSYVISYTGALGGLNFETEVEELEPTGAELKELEAAGEEFVEPVYEEEETAGRRDTVVFQLITTNLSVTPTSGPVTVTDTLPAGLTTAGEPEANGWSCKPTTEGATAVKCTTEQVINPDSQASAAIQINAVVDTSTVHEGEQLVNHATVSWESGKQVASDEEVVPIDATPAPFGLNNFAAGAFSASGAKDTVAGDHPYAATTRFFLNSVDRFNPGSEEMEILTPGRLKDADVILPEGFIGNPMLGSNPPGSSRCAQAEFIFNTKGEPGEVTHEGCHPVAQVGTANIFIKGFQEGAQGDTEVPVYNLVPPRGVPAEFGFVFLNLPVRIDAHVVRLEGKYKVTALSVDVNEAFNVNGIALTLWGTPADPSHNAERNQLNHSEKNATDPESPVKPFLSNPTDCLQQADQPPQTIVYYDPWEKPALLNAQGEPDLSSPTWLETEAESPPVTGCDQLSFAPKVAFQPRAKAEKPVASGTTQASAPSAYEFRLTVPQDEEPGDRITPELKDTEVVLPPGVSLSPSAANGLEACSAQQIGLESTQPGNCPLASQVGEVSIQSNLVEDELHGRVYVGRPECDPCTGADAAAGKLIHLYIEAEAPNAGVRVKLPGNATIDQSTGRVTSTFASNPQVPFTSLKLNLKGGPRASLANPQVCGEYTTASVLTPWSIGGKSKEGVDVLGGAPVSLPSSFKVDWDGEEGHTEPCPASLPFNPSFVAGTLDSTAGKYSQFDTVFARPDDREQAFSSTAGIVVHTPVGLLGKIAGVTRCEGEALEKLLEEEGTCPDNSRIATAISAAGPGSEPFQAEGPVYLTGAYKSPVTGAEGPFGLAIAVPAKTKAFNLGSVVVRAAISIDPHTSAITITADPPPLAKDGIPLRVQQIEVKVDRPEFMFNPTSCEPKSIEATIAGEPAAGEAAGVVTRKAPFQASNCAALPFAPKFTATTSGKATKREGTSLAVKVEENPGEANIGKVEVQLPISLPSRLETLQEACADNVFEANPAACPEHAVVGSATAHTPLLSSPLTGPAYLVSHANLSFPDLVFLLQGEGVHIELVGHTDIKKGITYSRFETVPDAPISSFETVFPKGRYSILGAIGNLCELEPKAPTTIISQSNKRFEQQTPIAVGECGPTVRVTSVKVSGKSLLVTLRTSGGGSIRISGQGLKTTTVSGLQKGTKQVRVRFTRSGVQAARHKKKIKLTATVSAGGQKASGTAKVKL